MRASPRPGLAGLLCHLLVLGGRAPAKILFAKDTGRVHQLELMTIYSDKGQLDKQEAVPLRLTRNMSTFFTSFGVEGIFLAAMVNAAQASGRAGAVGGGFFLHSIVRVGVGGVAAGPGLGLGLGR